MNGFIWLLFQFLGSQFLSIVSWILELVAFQLFNHKQSFYCGLDKKTFGYVLSFFGFKDETDVGINGCFAPFWLLGTHYLNFGCLVWSVMDLVVLLFFCGCFWRLRRNFIFEWFCLICCNISTKQAISRFAFWKLRLSVIQFIISAKFWLRMPWMDIETSIDRLCHSLSLRLRQLLRLVNLN